MSFKIWLESKDVGKKQFEKIGPYKVYLVSASAIRDKSTKDDDFNHFAVHEDFPSLIPDNEIWISRDIDEHERRFLVDNGVNRYVAKEKGIKDTYDYALKREKAEREKVDGIKFNKKEKVPDKVYSKLYCEIKEENIKVWLVDGEIIRDLYKTDFIEGGNPFVPYPWMPKDEIWIEKNLKERDRIATIIHEFVESTLIEKKKMSYDKAHSIAVKVDWHHRGKFNKSDIENLTQDEALRMAKLYKEN